MPFRFRRSIRIVPGLRLNVGRRGVSASVGGREGHVSAGTGGVRATATLPGTGISYTGDDAPRRGGPRTVPAARLVGPVVGQRGGRGRPPVVVRVVRMTGRIVTTLSLLLASVAPTVPAVAAEVMTLADLRAVCATPEAEQQAACRFFILGAFQGLQNAGGAALGGRWQVLRSEDGQDVLCPRQLAAKRHGPAGR
jgi:hypothetical protein